MKDAKGDIGATGLGLLPFLGAGHTHKQGSYPKTVSGGLNYLLARQQPDGSFPSLSLYEQAIAATAVCEAYGMSRDRRLKRPAQRALDYIVAAQHEGGGWRYTPKQVGDTSVTGWNFMALKSGQMAGLTIPKESWQRVSNFLDGVAAADGGYGYMGPSSSPSCTAIGLLCRQYLDRTPQRTALAKGIEILKKPLPPGENTSIYFYYYATQALSGPFGK